MAQVNFKTNYSSYTEHIKLAWALHSNPAAELGHVWLPYPNISGQATTISPLTTATYIFRFYLSVDGINIDSLDSEFSVDVKDDTDSIVPYYYTVDGGGLYNPVSGTNTWTDTRLIGAYKIVLSQKVNDFREPDVDYSFDGATGTITLLASGDEFVAADKWTVLVINKVPLTGSSTASDYTGVHEVAASEDFSDDYKSKHNYATGADGETIVTTFDDFSLIPDCRAKFNTYQMAARYWRLQFATGNTANVNGEDLNAITLRKGWMIELLFISGVCYVTEFKGELDKVGQFVYGTQKLLNTEYADGHEYDIADYQDLIDRLPSSMIVSYSVWDNYTDKIVGDVTRRYYYNRGKFAVDSGAGTFKFPDVRGYWFRAIRNLDHSSGTIDDTMLSQDAGGVWPMQFIKHHHAISTTGNQVHVDPGLALQRSNVNGDGVDYGQGVVPYMYSEGGDENIVDSVGLLALVRI